MDPAPLIDVDRLPSTFRLKLILTLFVSGLVVCLGLVMLGLSSRTFSRLGPSIRADLDWKAVRGARELAQSVDLAIVLKDEPMIRGLLDDYAKSPDVLAIVVADAEGKLLVAVGEASARAEPFAGPEDLIREAPDRLSSWAASKLDGRTVGKVAVVVSTERVRQVNELKGAVLSAVALACLVAVLLSVFFVGVYLGPLIALTDRALKRLTELTRTLDERVQERTQQLSESNGQLQESLKKLHEAQGQLVEASRKTGMADVATSVIHNVGNVLNSVNVSSGLVAETVRRSKSAGLAKLAELLSQGELAGLLATHPKGQQIPAYLVKLSEAVEQERVTILHELEGLQRNIEHIKVIVAMQQAHAKNSGGVMEPMSLKEIVDDAIKMNILSYQKHQLDIVREFAELPPLLLDRHKVFQIIMNLLSNARHAVKSQGSGPGRITLRLARNGDFVRLQVSDSGCGIAPESMHRIFNHGFTTKKDGHGFGLHSSANAATEMGGGLTCASDGVGKGATFTLDIPWKTVEAAA